MQIRIRPDGPWHRREAVAGGHLTACGGEIHAHSCRDVGVDRLCRVCFTSHEIERGELEFIAQEYAQYDIRSSFEPDDDPTDPTGSEVIAAAIKKADEARDATRR